MYINLLIALVSGFITSFIGIIPPGLLNMTAAKVNLKEGRKPALWFITGAVLVIFFQVFLAIFFARFINERPDIVLLLRELGCFVFTILTFYFLVIAKKYKLKKGKIKKKSSTKRFFLGMLLSGLNFFPIPYYVLVSISLSSFQWFHFELPFVSFFVLGAIAGSFLAFYCYITFFEKIQNKTDYLLRNMNTIIGSVTGLISLGTLVGIVRHYFG